MTRILAMLVAAAWLGPATALASPLRTMDEVGASLRACWNEPANPSGPFVTLSFSLRRDGRLLGAPEVTANWVPGKAVVRQRFALLAIEALERCTPLQLAPSLGDAIAGRVFTMPFFGQVSR